jgi:hypothetical protein
MSLDIGDNTNQNEINIDISQSEEFPQYLFLNTVKVFLPCDIIIISNK